MADSKPGGMSRREVLRKIVTTATGAALWPVLRESAPAGTTSKNTRKPNIVVILADDLGYADLGCYGGLCNTPTLDKMAKEGTRFTDFYVASPLCAPMRVGFLTGKYPQRTSLAWNPDYKNEEDGLSPDETTIAEYLKTAGYSTALVGKWHLGYAEKFRPWHQGFDEYYGFLSGWADYNEHTYRDGTKWMFKNGREFDEPGYMTDLLTREAVSFIGRNASRPFFLYLAYNAPHGPIQAPEEWVKRSDGDVYKGMVACLDDGIRKVLDEIRKRGLEKDTLVIFLSDNGSPKAERNVPFSGSKGSLWEGGIRVPFIARWPGRIPAGRVSAVPTFTLDLFPTFASLAGLKSPTGLDGQNIESVLFGKEKPVHNVIFWQFGNQSAVRKSRMKLLREKNKPDRLFDLVSDPSEKKDLATEKPDLVKELSDRLDKWLKSLEHASF